jgi:hypothetical protein
LEPDFYFAASIDGNWKIRHGWSEEAKFDTDFVLPEPSP